MRKQTRSERRNRLSSLLLVKKGGNLPPIPKEFAEYVYLMPVKGRNRHTIPFDHYDEWMVLNAEAGFTNRGSLRLEDKRGKIVTWISGQDMDMIIGVDGHGSLKENHHICFESNCGGIKKVKETYFDQDLRTTVIVTECTKCKKIKEYPKRPANHRSKKRVPKNLPPKYIQKEVHQPILVNPYN